MIIKSLDQSIAKAIASRINAPRVLEYFGDISFETANASAFSGGKNGVFYVIQPTVDGTVAIYQDAAGTIPADTADDPIKYVVDLSGNGLHAIQNDANPAGLTLKTDGELWWAQADATQNRPRIPAEAITGNTRSLVMGYTETGTDNSVILGADSDSGSAFLIGLNGSTSSTINANVTYTTLRTDGSSAALPGNRDQVWDIISLGTTFTTLGLEFSDTFVSQSTRLLGYDNDGWEAEGNFRSLVITDKELSGTLLTNVEGYVQSLAFPNQTYDLFLAAGQSNAQGRGDSSLSPTVATNTAFEFNGQTLVHLEDPVNGAITGSAWPAFCDGYYAATGNIPVIVVVAEGGTTQHSIADFGVGNWEAEGPLVQQSISIVNDMKATMNTLGLDYNWKGILWSQGERDAEQIQSNSSYNMDMYENAFLQMFNKFKAELGLETKLWWSRVGERGDVDSGEDQAYANLRDTQDALAANTDDVIMAFTGAFGFRDRGLMSDNYHYTQEGYNEMGTAMQNTITGV